MNQPTIEQFNQLQKKYFELEAKMNRLDLMEKKRDFTIRDSSFKIGITEGLATTTHEGISKLQHEMVQLRAAMKELRENNDQQLEILHVRFDQQEAMTKENAQRLSQMESSMATNAQRLSQMESSMATKDDIKRLEALIKQLLPPKQQP